MEEETEYETNTLTDWSNPPSIADLKQDFTEAQSAHDAHVSKINTWLAKRNWFC